MSAVIQNEYTGNNSTTTYSFTFPYLKTSDIKASLDGVETTAFTLPNATTLQFNTAPTNGAKIIIFRETSVDDLTATFYAGSAIKSEDLNDNFTQNLYKTQEVGVRSLNTLGGTMIGHLTIGEDKTIIFEGGTDDTHETTLTVADPTADRTITLPNVTGTVVTTGDTGTVATAMIAGDAVNGTKIADNSINSEHYVDGSIDRVHLAADIVDGTKIADDSINSEHYAAGSIDLEHMSANSVNSDQYVDGSIDRVHLAADIVDGTKIADNSIDSEHYVDGSIDTAHIADAQITTAKIADTNITTAKIADDAVTAAKLAENCVNVEQIVADAVRTSEIQNNAVTTDKLASSAVTNAKLANNAVQTGNIVDSSVQTAKIADANVTTAKIADNAITAAKIADGVIVTNSEQASHSVDDTTFFTTAAAEARYFNATTTETIKNGDAFPDNDTTIATTAAINDRIIDLVDDVGGFVPIASETNFPTANPDVNNGSGTLVSIKAIGSTRTPSSGTVTIANGSGSNTVTITGCGSTVLTAGFGVIVETTSTLHTYAFHRLVPKATEVTTVAANAVSISAAGANVTDINNFVDRYQISSSAPTTRSDSSSLVLGDFWFDSSSNKVMMVYDGTSGDGFSAVSPDASTITNVNTVAGQITFQEDLGAITDAVRTGTGNSTLNTVAGIASNVTTVAGIASNVTAVANDATDIGAVAGKATEIGRLGTADAVADLAILGTTDVVADLNTLATTAIVSDMDTLADISSNITTVAGIASNVTAVANDATDIGAVAAKATEIGRLGTADAVADMNTLGTTAIVSDMDTLADISSNITTVAGISSNVTSVAGNASNINSAVSNASNINAAVSNASNINTVAGNNTNINTVAGVSSNITTVAGIASNVTAVAGDATDIGVVAGKATEIGRLGTADAVADLAILGTTDVVSDMNTLATSANVTAMDNCSDDIANINTVSGSIANVNTAAGSISNVNTTASNISNVNTVAGISANVTTVAGNSSNVTTVAGSISNVNTVATSISDVNNFANRYRIASSAPTSSLDVGDLYFDSSANELRVYNGSAWQGGVTATSGFLQRSGGQMTGNITMSGSQTVDGRDLSADGSKLDGIESGATADQTNAEIRAAVEAASDSNVFTDADHTKLNGIEASATADQTAAEIRTLVESASDSNVFTDADHSKLNGIASGATNVTNTNQLTNGAGFITATLTNEQVQDIVGGMVSSNTESGITVTYQDSDGTLDFSVASQTDNNFTNSDHSKLDGIESGATADQTASEIVALISGQTIAPNVITTTNLTLDFGSIA